MLLRAPSTLLSLAIYDYIIHKSTIAVLYLAADENAVVNAVDDSVNLSYVLSYLNRWMECFDFEFDDATGMAVESVDDVQLKTILVLLWFHEKLLLLVFVSVLLS